MNKQILRLDTNLQVIATESEKNVAFFGTHYEHSYQLRRFYWSELQDKTLTPSTFQEVEERELQN